MTKYPVGSQVQFIADDTLKVGTVAGVSDDHRIITVRGEAGVLTLASNLMPVRQTARDPHFEFVVRFEALWRAFKMQEGAPHAMIAALGALCAEIIRYKAELEEESES